MIQRQSTQVYPDKLLTERGQLGKEIQIGRDKLVHNTFPKHF